MSNLLSGNLDEAERYFTQALSQVSDIDLGDLLESFQQNRSLVRSNATISNESCQKQGCSRQEYDEGICPVFEALQWQEHTDDSIKTAILMYNVRQRNRKRKNFVKAQKWFVRAGSFMTLEKMTDVQTLKISDQDSTSTGLVPISRQAVR
jgi:hypothetical protein